EHAERTVLRAPSGLTAEPLARRTDRAADAMDAALALLAIGAGGAGPPADSHVAVLFTAIADALAAADDVVAESLAAAVLSLAGLLLSKEAARTEGQGKGQPMHSAAQRAAAGILPDGSRASRGPD